MRKFGDREALVLIETAMNSGGRHREGACGELFPVR